jgi:hypothetical protein
MTTTKTTAVDQLADCLSSWRGLIDAMNESAAMRTPVSTAAPRLLAAVEAVLADHTDSPVYMGADECDHPEPAVSAPLRAWQAEWDAWSADHPLGAGDVGRICLRTEVGRYCPACTQLVYEDDPIGDSYVHASNCIVRPTVAHELLGDDSDGG